jgi:tetratricopeptide (TPR) repeat protein
LNNLGNIAMSSRALGDARGYYERALAIDPSFATALFHLGLVDYYQGDSHSARERWRRVLSLDPDHARARKALKQLR